MKVYKKIREADSSFFGQAFFLILMGMLVSVLIVTHELWADFILILAILITIIIGIVALWYESSTEKLVETDMEVR